MLFAKPAFLLSLFALGNIVAAADSSACLLSALGSEKSPGDLNAVCVDRVQKRIDDVCSGGDKKAALKLFADTCASAGHKVVINSSSSADSATGTSTGTSTATSTGDSKSTETATTGTGFATASATSTSGSGVHSSSGSSSNAESSSSSTSEETPLQTNSAGSSDRHVSAAAFAAVVFVGFAATL